MHYTVKHLPQSQIEITVTVPPEEMRAFYETALKSVTRTAEVEGFRPGKAPAEIVKKKVGDFAIWEEASVKAAEKTYPEIIRELQEKEGDAFEPIGAPRVRVTTLVPNEAMEYRAELALLPTIDLGNYGETARKINKEKEEVAVTEKEVADSVEWLRKSRATLRAVARPAARDDRVEIDFEARLGEAPLPNGSAKNHTLFIGEGSFMPGFEDTLIGMNAGETKTFAITAPADYVEPSLRGKSIDFTVTMRDIQERLLPELTDSFAVGLGNFADVSALEKSIREGIAAEKEEKERERMRIRIADAIAESIRAEIPDTLKERELQKMTAELQTSITRMGIDWTAYLQNLGKTEELLRKDWEKDAVRRVKIALILRSIAKRAGLEPTEEEIQAAANQNVARLGVTEEDFTKIDKEAFQEYNIVSARNEKVFRYLEELR